MFRSRAGHYDKVEEYDAAQNDMLKGDLRELDADGNAKEDGIVVEQAVLMPEYIKVEDQKSLFDGAKLGSVITFNPKKAYPESNAEIKSLLKISDEQAVAESTINVLSAQTSLGPNASEGEVTVDCTPAKDVLNKLPMEFAVEAQKLLSVSLEGTVG